LPQAAGFGVFLEAAGLSGQFLRLLRVRVNVKENNYA